MSSKIIKIKKKDGILFSKVSGDYNKIHLDDLYGYNSLFGAKVAHGVLLIIFILNKLSIYKKLNNLDEYYLETKFLKPILYNKPIKLPGNFKINKTYKIYQENNIISTLKILDENILLEKKPELLLQKNVLLKQSKKLDNIYIPKKLFDLFCAISKYVGTINPGEHSLLSEIKINYNKYFNYKNVRIYSKKIKNLPIINNFMEYENYNATFQSIIRPKLLNKKEKLNKKILTQIKEQNRNVLILGASSGIGKSTLDLYLKNKDIKILATSYNNTIKNNEKNLITKKINIEKDIKRIVNLINKYKISRIYYFPTPKIYFDDNLKNETKKLFDFYYVQFPKQLLNLLKNINLEFFFPSTTYVQINPNSIYSKYKLKSEAILDKFRSQNIKINIYRFPGIDTKQNLSIIPQNLSTLFEILKKDNILFKKFFFK